MGDSEMCLDDCKEMPEELAKLLLPIYQERSNQLANIIMALNGLIITILAGVLTFSGTIHPSFSNLEIISGICVLSLTIWRLYAHYVDNEIIQLYGKILCCEFRIGVPFNLSLLSNLISQLPDDTQTKQKLNALIESKNFSKAYSEMIILTEKKNVGPRGHDRIDKIALAAILSFVIFGTIAIYFSPGFFTSNVFASFIFGFLWAFIIILIAIYPDFDKAKNPD